MNFVAQTAHLINEGLTETPFRVVHHHHKDPLMCLYLKLFTVVDAFVLQNLSALSPCVASLTTMEHIEESIEING